MSRKIIIASIIIVSILAVGGGVYSPSFGWLRDANISHSSDNIGVGWIYSYYLTAEKKLDKNASLGMYYLSTTPIQNDPFNFFQISYNRQIIGIEEDGFGFSYYIGFIYCGREISVIDSPFQNVFPDLGMAMRWKLNEPLTFRLHSFYILPYFFEFAYEFQKNAELGLGLGYPFQLLGLRYCF